MNIYQKILLFLFFVFVAYIYLHNLSHSIYGGDVGDLVSAAVVMGVPHAPGYPLFVSLGHLLSLLPISLTPVYKVGIISVLSGLASLLLYFILIYRITKKFFISFLSTAIFSFSYLFWLYNEIAEVFALNNLIVIALLFCSISFSQTKEKKYYFFTVFLAGLALTNHQTSILVFPSIFLILFGRQIIAYIKLFLKKIKLKKKPDNAKFYKKFLILDKKDYLFSGLLFLVGLSPYVYIPFAARANPPINWDDARTITNFIHLVLRQDYGTFSAGNFTPSTIIPKIISLKDYFIVFISSVTFPAFIVEVIGIGALYKRHRFIGISLFLAWVVTGPVFILYAGFPLYNYFTFGVVERFYILSSVIFLFFLPYGFVTIQAFFERFFSQRLFAVIVMCGFLLIPAQLFFYNGQKTDLSAVTIGDEVAKNILQPLPQNAVLFVSGDTLTFNTWYVNYALHVRPDVILVHILGAGNKTYINQQEHIYLQTHTEKNAKAHMFPALYSQILAHHQIFSLVPFTTNLDHYTWQPVGLTYKLVNEDELIAEDNYKQEEKKVWGKFVIPSRTHKDFARGNLTISEIPNAYSDSLLATGKFFQEKYSDGVEAKIWFEKAIRIDPENARPYSSLGLLYYSYFHDCKTAGDYFSTALSKDTLNDDYYVIYYLIQSSCLHNDTRLVELRKKYQRIFHQSLDQDVKKKAAAIHK